MGLELTGINILDKSIGFLALLILCIPSIIILREYFGREK